MGKAGKGGGVGEARTHEAKQDACMQLPQNCAYLSDDSKAESRQLSRRCELRWGKDREAEENMCLQLQGRSVTSCLRRKKVARHLETLNVSRNDPRTVAGGRVNVASSSGRRCKKSVATRE
jgi:hypothetical protein